ncbi:hypothetical protein [Burkholderia sp. LMG 32019]|uniref:hypothetical protein n=1 Tax=Burkholderia sp. LMG 32019 TaxID=3158173 RepID=UPI003C30B910
MSDENFDEYDEPDVGPRYEAPESIDANRLVVALQQLHLVKDDPYMRSQAHNLAIVDQFLMSLEYNVLRELHERERTPPNTYFLSAQSQMWIFAAYELLRTWQQRARDFVKWADSGGFRDKLRSLKEKGDGYRHFGREIRIRQLEAAAADPIATKKILTDQIAHLHIPYTRLEWIRVSIAKHEISGKNKDAAFTPGYGRINSECGAIDYELENGVYSMGYINRRDIADSIRKLDFSRTPPSEQDLQDFDAYMSGKFTPLP